MADLSDQASTDLRVREPGYPEIGTSTGAAGTRVQKNMHDKVVHLLFPEPLARRARLLNQSSGQVRAGGDTTLACQSRASQQRQTQSVRGCTSRE